MDAASAIGDVSAAWSVSQGSARKFVSNKFASLVTSTSSSSLLGGNEVGHVEAGECFSPKSEGECPPSQEAPQ